METLTGAIGYMEFTLGIGSVHMFHFLMIQIKKVAIKNNNEWSSSLNYAADSLFLFDWAILPVRVSNSWSLRKPWLKSPSSAKFPRWLTGRMPGIWVQIVEKDDITVGCQAPHGTRPIGQRLPVFGTNTLRSSPHWRQLRSPWRSQGRLRISIWQWQSLTSDFEVVTDFFGIGGWISFWAFEKVAETDSNPPLFWDLNLIGWISRLSCM